MIFVDTHCHLNFKAFKSDLSDVVGRAYKSDVGKIIIPGAKLDSSQKAVEISGQYKGCFAAIGIHPHHVHDVNSFLQNDQKRHELSHLLADMAKQKGVAAIGEVGLDRHSYKNYPPVEEKTFQLQKQLLSLELDVATQLHLPVILHCRDAQDEMIALINEYKNKHPDLTGVFHCFEGTLLHLKKILSMGFFVGFDGNITFKENMRLQELVRQTPIDRLLLETDSPYLTPLPHRGTRNEPAYIQHTYAFVALLKNTGIKKVALRLSANVSTLFHI